jgi:trichothecene 3-O-acetyltransferase
MLAETCPIQPQLASDQAPQLEPQNSFQDVVGQFPQLKSYNQGLMVFALDDNKSRKSVTTALKAAINCITAKVPWLGEQVICVGECPGNSGEFKTTPWPVDDAALASGPAKFLLHVKDRTDLCSSYDELAKRGCPISMLDGDLLCPLPSFPLSYDEAKIGPAPVVAVQANFIKGGLILNFSNQHNMMDASGMFVFIALIAAALQGQELPQNLVEAANLDRSRVIPLLEPGQPIRDHSHLLKINQTQQTSSSTASTLKLRPARWACFHLFKEHVLRIKAAASVATDFDPSVKFVSTNDALSAFYWKRLAAVRLANGNATPAARSKFSRAIDVRSPLGVPPGYMGQMVYHAATYLSCGELASGATEELTLSTVASRLRVDLNASNNEWAVRSYATFLASVPDKTTLVYGGGLNPALDVGSSAMSMGSPGTLEFGLLGVPTFLRRPNLVPVPGLMYVYPPERDTGDLPVLVCLPDEDLEGLEKDREWGACTRLVG